MMDIILTRKSVRKFKSDPVAEDDIKDILKAAMQAPSAGNEQAWQFIVLNGEVLTKYLDINPNCPKGAPVGILVCRDLKAEKYEGYSVHDCAAATASLLLAAHAKGLGSVWTTVFPQAQKKICDLLGLPENIVPFALTPIGYPASPTGSVEKRYDSAKVHYNSW